MTNTRIAIEGLLHLGALSVVLTTGYLGVDRLQADRLSFYNVLEKISSNTKGVLDVLGITEKVTLPTYFLSTDVLVLCYISKVKVKNCPLSILITSFLVRWWNFPLLGYFRCKADRYIMSAAAVLSLISFIILVNVSMFEDANLWAVDLPIYLFWFYTVVVFWTFGSAAVAALRLKNVHRVCQKMQGRIQDNMKEFASFDFNLTIKDLNGLSVSDVDGH